MELDVPAADGTWRLAWPPRQDIEARSVEGTLAARVPPLAARVWVRD